MLEQDLAIVDSVAHEDDLATGAHEQLVDYCKGVSNVYAINVRARQDELRLVIRLMRYFGGSRNLLYEEGCLLR